MPDESYLASMGIYVFDSDVLRDELADIDKTDFGKEVIPEAIARRKVVAYPFHDYWRDIGTIGAFYEANLELVRKDPEFNLYQGDWPFYTRSRSLPPSRIVESEIRDSLVVEGATITGATIENSIVGIRAKVGEGSYLKDTILMGSDFYEGEQELDTRLQADATAPAMGVGRNCRIERTIIDKNVRIGDNVVVAAHPDVAEHQGEQCWIRDGVTILPKGTILANGTEL